MSQYLFSLLPNDSRLGSALLFIILFKDHDTLFILPMSFSQTNTHTHHHYHHSAFLYCLIFCIKHFERKEEMQKKV